METLELDDIQGLIRHGYPGFDVADYLLFRIDDVQGARDWLTRLRLEDQPQVYGAPIGTEAWLDSAEKRAARLRQEDCGVAIAFTAPGLRRLGLDAQSMSTFVAEFQEGMPARHRARLLGDVDANAPRLWNWGKAAQLRDLHGLLIVFYRPTSDNVTPTAQIESLPGCPTVTYRFHGVFAGHEPFGFADGISQPFVEGLTRKKAPPGVRRVKAGEFVLGYLNEFGAYSASPSVPADVRADGLLPLLGASGRADFGRNGSYLVMRQLEQHVDRFDAFLAGLPPGRQMEVAAKMVGRRMSGAPLMRDYGGDVPEPRTRDELEQENDFDYHREDRHGFRCPVGSHIRRANPRDSLADEAGVTPGRAQAMVDRHRVLRRGRVYKDGQRQGLLFLCVNANIERQFEFVQSSWLLNPEFNGLQGETDPLLGGVSNNQARTMTLQHHRLPERCGGLGQFVTVRGGAYFFVPGLRAIDYLAR